MASSLDVQQIADQRFRISLAPSGTESTAEVILYDVNVSLSIAGVGYA
ncbi:hypothetical protein [Bradyrhizobium sp. WSM2254]|nr:hypothetical protein [Bradyrhizobium sp. WSM2254]